MWKERDRMCFIWKWVVRAGHQGTVSSWPLRTQVWSSGGGAIWRPEDFHLHDGGDIVSRKFLRARSSEAGVPGLHWGSVFQYSQGALGMLRLAPPPRTGGERRIFFFLICMASNDNMQPEFSTTDRLNRKHGQKMRKANKRQKKEWPEDWHRNLKYFWKGPEGWELNATLLSLSVIVNRTIPES